MPSWKIPHGIVFGASTRLLDIYTPTPLLLLAPSVDADEQEMAFFLHEGVCPAFPRRRDAWLPWRRSHLKRSLRVSPTKILYDVRQHGIENVAHLLQGALAPMLAGLEALGLEKRLPDMILVVSPGTPDYSINILGALGFTNVIVSRRPVAGTILTINPRKFLCSANASRFLRRHLARIGFPHPNGKPGQPLFLSRRGRRAVSNAREVTNGLESMGYRTVYLEDLPVQEQIRLVMAASKIVACHGAGMSYAYFRDPSTRGVMVELFSCGFITSWGRTNAYSVNDAWVGMQGRLDGKVVPKLYNAIHGHSFEAMNYEVDWQSCVAAVRAAECLGIGGRLDDALVAAGVSHIALKTTGRS